MKRRTFLTSVAAATATPLMPNIALGAPSTIAPTLYAKAAHWAGLWAHSSANMLKSVFYLDDATAKLLFEQLQNNHVITRPNAYGMSKVLLPTYKTPAHLVQMKTVFEKVTTDKTSAFDKLKTSHTPKKTTPKLDKAKIEKSIDRLLDDPNETIPAQETTNEVPA